MRPLIPAVSFKDNETCTESLRACAARCCVVIKTKREYGQASRKISTGRLNALPHLDLQPINQIFSLVPSVYLK